MHRPLLFTSLLLSLTGCYSSGTADPAPLPAPAVSLDLACAPSSLDVAWVSEDPGLHGSFHPVSLEVAPGDALLMRGSGFGGDVVRMRDGAQIATTSSPPIDAAWARSVIVDPETREVIVRELATGATVRTIASGADTREGWWGETIARLSDDGARALVLDCDQSGDATHARLRGVDLASGAIDDVTLPLGCSELWPRRTELRALAGGTAALVIGLRPRGPAWIDDVRTPANVIARVDLARGGVSTVVAVSDARPPLALDLAFDVLDAAISDDERVLAVTGRDGVLRRFDTTTLQPIGEPIEVGMAIANPVSYLPSIESAVALSPTGAWIAHVDTEGAIVVRDAASGAIAAELAMPFDRREDGSGFGPPVAMALRFVDDGLIVGASSGVARFGCGGVTAEPVRPSGDLVVRASAPEVVRSGEPARFTIDVEGAALPVVRAVRFGDSAMGAIGRDLEVWMPGPGTTTVEIVVDDGVRTARAEARLEVLPAAE
ncbi:hypothetical protein [Sandaracinus amylolyticus]|uniref:Uncharacterized protein n=1 Tax=Sandaracinus amylolyticus TaxID=927083 RepID=A0A0F6SI87_9BACT|nr:hypothetical protein [Sandaracinus amylolyticus]AKF11764.1 hypothetical protein DB32_008913 [Sandaracinus amylolyticus]